MPGPVGSFDDVIRSVLQSSGGGGGAAAPQPVAQKLPSLEIISTLQNIIKQIEMQSGPMTDDEKQQLIEDALSNHPGTRTLQRADPSAEYQQGTP